MPLLILACQQHRSAPRSKSQFPLINKRLLSGTGKSCVSDRMWSNTLWFASAIIDRKSGHVYGALTNCSGERGVAITSQILERISLRSPST